MEINLAKRHLDFLENEFSLSVTDLGPLTSKQKSNLYRELSDIEIVEINKHESSERGKIAADIADFLYDTYYQKIP